MFINSTLHGACVAPFYDASLFPPEGGCMSCEMIYLLGVYTLTRGQISVAVFVRNKIQQPRYVVCLVQHRIGPIRTVSHVDTRVQLYLADLQPLDFETLGTVAGWLNVAGLVLQSFMLISNTFLPAAKTRSHYLTQCLIIAVIWINVG
jgi:hypothetical protein